MTDPVPAVRGRAAMRFLVAFCTSVSAMSLIALAYQTTYRLPDGELFRDTPLAWHHLLGHLLRGVGLGASASPSCAAAARPTRPKPP